MCVYDYDCTHCAYMYIMQREKVEKSPLKKHRFKLNVHQRADKNSQMHFQSLMNTFVEILIKWAFV